MIDISYRTFGQRNLKTVFQKRSKQKLLVWLGVNFKQNHHRKKTPQYRRFFKFPYIVVPNHTSAIGLLGVLDMSLLIGRRNPEERSPGHKLYLFFCVFSYTYLFSLTIVNSLGILVFSEITGRDT